MAALILVLIAARLGAFQAEFGGIDEAAHLVSGIMVYEYLLQGLPKGIAPLTFAANYYDHYPKVAIGHWPPVFYCLEASWFLVAGLSRASVMLFSCLISGVFAGLTFLLGCRLGLTRPLSVCAAMVCALLPQTVISTVELNSDILTATMAVGAAYACHLWLERLTLRSGMFFSVVASLAVLVKGNAFPVFLLPAWILTHPQRLRIVTRIVFWLPLVVAVALFLPWYALHRELAVAEIVPGGTTSLTGRMMHSAMRNLRDMEVIGGPGLLILSLLSLVPAVGGKWIERMPVVAAIPVAFWIFLSFLSPHTETRLLLACAPVLCLAAAITVRRLPIALACLILLSTLFPAYLSQAVPRKPFKGWVDAVRFLRSQPGRTLLVASNGMGEGGLISELALVEPEPRFVVRRSSKLLQQSNWMGTNVRPLVAGVDEVRTLLDQQRIESVVLEIDPSRPVSHTLHLLEDAIADWPRNASIQNIRVHTRKVSQR